MQIASQSKAISAVAHKQYALKVSRRSVHVTVASSSARTLRTSKPFTPVITTKTSRRSLSVTSALAGASKFYDYSVKDIDGKEIKMSQFKGKVCLIVNLASQCGFTPQYAELQQLQDKYGSKGFTVIGFPCNQFGGQEPGSNSDIKRFATSKFAVSFPLMAKVDVNGSGTAPVFEFLKSQKGGLINSEIKWNFSKFLVDKEGNVVGRYASTSTPASLEADIQKHL